MSINKKQDFEKCATFYFTKDLSKFIVGIWSQNQNRIHYEVTALPVMENFEHAVETFWKSILKSTSKEKDFKNNKLTDWPAFKVSGFKTVKAFKNEYRKMFVIAFNSSNIIYDCRINLSDEIDYSIHATLSPGNSLKEKMRTFKFLMEKSLE